MSHPRSAIDLFVSEVVVPRMRMCMRRRAIAGALQGLKFSSIGPIWGVGPLIYLILRIINNGCLKVLETPNVAFI